MFPQQSSRFRLNEGCNRRKHLIGKRLLDEFTGHLCTNLGEPRGGERYRVLCNGALYRLADLDRDLDLQKSFRKKKLQCFSDLDGTFRFDLKRKRK